MFVGGQKEMLTVLSQLGIPQAQAGDWEGIARIVLNKSGNPIQMELYKFMKPHIISIYKTSLILQYLILIGREIIKL